MGWDSFVSSVTSTAQTGLSFGKGVLSGAKDGVVSMATGVKDLAVGAYKVATDPVVRQQAINTASTLSHQAADYGSRLIDDPATRQQAYDRVQQFVGDAKDQFVAARELAEQQGRLAEFYGEVTGRAGFEVAAIAVPATKLGQVGKAGAAAEEATELARTAKLAESLPSAHAGQVVTRCPELGDVLLSRSEVARIQALPKGQRPIPGSYLPDEYIEAHLKQFDQGASRLMLRSNLDKYGIAQRDGTSFVMPSHEVDALLAKADGNISALEDALGLPEGTLANNELVRVDIPSPRGLGLRIPSGNEAGANSLWIPGGRLPDGNLEAVLDAASLTPEAYRVTPIRLP